MRARGVTSSVSSHSRYGFLPSAVRYSRTFRAETRAKLSHTIRIVNTQRSARMKGAIVAPKLTPHRGARRLFGIRTRLISSKPLQSWRLEVADGRWSAGRTSGASEIELRNALRSKNLR